MAELLTIVAGHTVKDPASYGPGDVIVVCDDGHQWGVDEVTNPNWRIIHAPGAAADYLHLLEPDFDAEENIVRRRKLAIALDTLGLKDHVPETTKQIVQTSQVKSLTPVERIDEDGKPYTDTVVEWEPVEKEIDAIEPIEIASKQVLTAAVVIKDAMLIGPL